MRRLSKIDWRHHVRLLGALSLVLVGTPEVEIAIRASRQS